MKRILFLVLVLLFSATLSGCHFYLVEDTRTGQKYVTKGPLNDMAGPGIVFTDGLTGEKVRVTHYRKDEISGDAYKDAVESGVAP